ncbi:HEAT repeat domain-containing protein [Methanogenium cariaci]|uniref:HEAT repeat domain-containing protein n=1 Tax=Methanogenium cariaci TaxID=2197 RepID=UPI002480E5EF|nr:HEAT repeat domain-containing protein [Methanogenium cariaci]
MFLESDNLTSRWKAAEILGNMHAKEALEPLIKALLDEYVDVSWIAAKSLGKLGDKRATLPLIDCLDSEEQWLRKGGGNRSRDA